MKIFINEYFDALIRKHTIINFPIKLGAKKNIIRVTYVFLLTLLITTETLGDTITSDNLEQDIPTLGNSSSNLVSIEQERKLGEAWLRSLRGQTNPFQNALVEEYFSNLVYSLAPQTDVKDRDFSFVIIDSTALNAFAVPGSIIGINAGLFLNTSNEQEFASVLAHELAHLGQRHFARQLEQQKLSGPLTLAGILASVVIAATTGSSAGLAALASTQALSADQQLRFSRKNEQEADRIGLKTMYQSHFDPKAMPVMFERLFKKNRIKGEALPEYLSTHPLSENRIADTRNRASQYPVERYQDNIEFYFCKSMVITYYADSAVIAANYFQSIIEKGNTAQILAAKFGLAYASREVNPKKSLKLLDELLKLYPNKITLLITKAQALQSDKQNKLAIKTLEALLERNPENYPVSDALVDTYLKNDRIISAEQLLTEMSRRNKENPKIWYLLAETNGLAGHIVELHLARAEYYFLTNHLDEALSQLNLALKKNKNNETMTARIQKRMDELYQLKDNPIL